MEVLDGQIDPEFGYSASRNNDKWKVKISGKTFWTDNHSHLDMIGANVRVTYNVSNYQVEGQTRHSNWIQSMEKLGDAPVGAQTPSVDTSALPPPLESPTHDLPPTRPQGGPPTDKKIFTQTYMKCMATMNQGAGGSTEDLDYWCKQGLQCYETMMKAPY